MSFFFCTKTQKVCIYFSSTAGSTILFFVVEAPCNPFSLKQCTDGLQEAVQLPEPPTTSIRAHSYKDLLQQHPGSKLLGTQMHNQQILIETQDQCLFSAAFGAIAWTSAHCSHCLAGTGGNKPQHSVGRPAQRCLCKNTRHTQVPAPRLCHCLQLRGVSMVLLSTCFPSPPTARRNNLNNLAFFPPVQFLVYCVCLLF